MGKESFDLKTAVEQINGREGETATLLSNRSCFPKLACWRFRPTSSQPLAASCRFAETLFGR